MKKSKSHAMIGKLGLAVALSVLVWAHQNVQAIILDFSNLPDAVISFDGTDDSFEFLPNAGAGDRNLQITTSNGVGDSVGLLGTITGKFFIGAISGTDVQTADVTGTGAMIIEDAAGELFTGDLVWDEIASFGTGGIINVNAIINVTDLSYSGTNADLIALRDHLHLVQTVTFQFVPRMSLSELTEGGPHTTSFSGSIGEERRPPGEIPDPGSSAVLLGLAMLGLSLLKRRGDS